MGLMAHHMGIDPSKAGAMKKVPMKHIRTNMVGGLPRVESLRKPDTAANVFRQIKGVPR